MKPPRRRVIAAALALGVLLPAAAWWLRPDAPRYLPADTVAFVALFAPPPAPDSAATRRELDELLELQRLRSDTEVAAARADRKTEVERFRAALGLRADAPLPFTHRLADRAENEVRIYVRAVKDRFRRLRPYRLEPRLEPCIANVRDDLSYPSGHAAYGYALAYLLAELVPERRAALVERARVFARQRMVCGVHFPSDLEAGREAAAWIVPQLLAHPEFRAQADEAARELRRALESVAGK